MYTGSNIYTVRVLHKAALCLLRDTEEGHLAGSRDLQKKRSESFQQQGSISIICASQQNSLTKVG
jgi:hypothetical protein